MPLGKSDHMLKRLPESTCRPKQQKTNCLTGPSTLVRLRPTVSWMAESSGAKSVRLESEGSERLNWARPDTVPL